MEHFTEGAKRALRLATELAAEAGEQMVEALHLLGALLREETRAAEILQEFGISEAAVELAETSGGGGSGSSGEPQASEALQQVIDEARRHAMSAGRHLETGTEHLLWGLVSVESPAAEFLRRHGIDASQLSGLVEEQAGVSTQPLEPDFSIRWRDTTESDRTDVFRVLDAAANRAREGLRVAEDFVRFTLDDAHLTSVLKACRHDLTDALRTLDSSALLAARDTLQDVGTTVSTTAEEQRATPFDVVQAAFKRVQEAARTLEEYGKIVDAAFAKQIEQTRYRLYTLEKAVLLTQANRHRLDGRGLYLLVTESLCHHGSGPAIRDALAAGAGVVQLREKEWPDRRIVEHGRRVREWTRAAGALFIMNDRPDLAVLTEADGVHVGQDELSVREARRIVGPDRLVGVSTHTIEQARQAVLDGADYLGVGPVFPSPTKAFDEFPGLEFVRQVAADITLPWYAIGGIEAENIGEVVAAGATRVAVSSAVCAAEDPGRAASLLLSRLRDERGDSH